MDSELKARWIEALESGKYKKGTSYLCENDSYCCLGVLADIENLFDNLSLENENKTVKGHLSLLPQDIAKYYGLINPGPNNDFTLQLELAVINDRTDTFNEVIDYIKEHL